MNEDCTVYKTMSFISKKWTLLILLELYKGEKEKKRYSEIKKKMEEITPKVLTARLRELEKEGLINRKVDASSFPVKTEYSLTESGKDFIPIISQIKSWALRWKPHQEICDSIECNNCTL
ncbi:MAG: helix-turn-helix domain-containing protein [Candidatus Thermoplasmatota archaeon]